MYSGDAVPTGASRAFVPRSLLVGRQARGRGATASGGASKHPARDAAGAQGVPPIARHVEGAEGSRVSSPAARFRLHLAIDRVGAQGDFPDCRVLRSGRSRPLAGRSRREAGAVVGDARADDPHRARGQQGARALGCVLGRSLSRARSALTPRGAQRARLHPDESQTSRPRRSDRSTLLAALVRGLPLAHDATARFSGAKSANMVGQGGLAASRPHKHLGSAGAAKTSAASRASRSFTRVRQRQTARQPMPPRHQLPLSPQLKPTSKQNVPQGSVLEPGLSGGAPSQTHYQSTFSHERSGQNQDQKVPFHRRFERTAACREDLRGDTMHIDRSSKDHLNRALGVGRAGRNGRSLPRFRAAAGERRVSVAPPPGHARIGPDRPRVRA